MFKLGLKIDFNKFLPTYKNKVYIEVVVVNPLKITILLVFATAIVSVIPLFSPIG